MARHHGGTIVSVFCFFIFSGFGRCRERPAFQGDSPPGYNLNKPTQKFLLGDALHEISGLALLNGNSDTLYAIEDENGRLFYFHPGDGKYPSVKFGKKGDFEDLSILPGNEMAVLRSDGSLYTFPLSLPKDGSSPAGGVLKDQVREYEQILPAGEYEGLATDEDGSLIALCKNCPADDQRDDVSAYTLRKDANGQLAVTNHFMITVSKEAAGRSSKRKAKFHPSCLARHPLTHEWYIISSVNKILLVLDGQWKVKETYRLDPTLFKQPEGLAFDKKGNLYISNEGGEGTANLLLFSYRQPN